jgi:hypothetical protein
MFFASSLINSSVILYRTVHTIPRTSYVPKIRTRVGVGEGVKGTSNLNLTKRNRQAQSIGERGCNAAGFLPGSRLDSGGD